MDGPVLVSAESSPSFQHSRVCLAEPCALAKAVAHQVIALAYLCLVLLNEPESIFKRRHDLRSGLPCAVRLGRRPMIQIDRSHRSGRADVGSAVWPRWSVARFLLKEIDRQTALGLEKRLDRGLR